MKNRPINSVFTTVKGLSGNHGLSYTENHTNTLSDSRKFKKRMSHTCPASSSTTQWAETLIQRVTESKGRETRNINLYMQMKICVQFEFDLVSFVDGCRTWIAQPLCLIVWCSERHCNCIVFVFFPSPYSIGIKTNACLPS